MRISRFKRLFEHDNLLSFSLWWTQNTSGYFFFPLNEGKLNLSGFFFPVISKRTHQSFQTNTLKLNNLNKPKSCFIVCWGGFSFEMKYFFSHLELQMGPWLMEQDGQSSLALTKNIWHWTPTLPRYWQNYKLSSVDSGNTFSPKSWKWQVTILF